MCMTRRDTNQLNDKEHDPRSFPMRARSNEIAAASRVEDGKGNGTAHKKLLLGLARRASRRNRRRGSRVERGRARTGRATAPRTRSSCSDSPVARRVVIDIVGTNDVRCASFVTDDQPLNRDFSLGDVTDHQLDREGLASEGCERRARARWEGPRLQRQGLRRGRGCATAKETAGDEQTGRGAWALGVRARRREPSSSGPMEVSRLQFEHSPVSWTMSSREAFRMATERDGIAL